MAYQHLAISRGKFFEDNSAGSITLLKRRALMGSRFPGWSVFGVNYTVDRVSLSTANTGNGGWGDNLKR